MRKLSWAALAALLLPLCACGQTAPPALAPPPDTGRVELSFDYQAREGLASNQFAVWVEDMQGGYVTTLFVTRFTAGGGYKSRPEALPRWVRASGRAAMKKSDADAMASATPQSGPLRLVWDLTDSTGNAAPAGEYRFLVEGNLYWHSRVLYTGVIPVGGGPARVQALEPEYTADEAAAEPVMLGPVTAEYLPKGED